MTNRRATSGEQSRRNCRILVWTRGLGEVFIIPLAIPVKADRARIAPKGIGGAPACLSFRPTHSGSRVKVHEPIVRFIEANSVNASRADSTG